MAKIQLTGKESDFLKIGVAAAGRGDLEGVSELLDKKPQWIHTIGSHGRTMLWEAAYRGKLEMVEFLLDRGADINPPGCHLSQHTLEITPYCIARHEGRDSVADYLLERGAEIDIHTAAYLGDYETANSLLQNDPKLVNKGYLESVMLPSGGPHSFEHRYSEDVTPLCYSIIGGNIRIVELFISKGAIVEPHSELLLDHAVSENRIDLVKLLVKHGADPSKAPSIVDDKSEMSVLLKSYGLKPKDINASCYMGWPPIVYVCRGDKGEHPEEVIRLLELGADIDVRSSKGKSALHCAAKAGFLKVINLLLEKGANIDATDNRGETPIFDVIRTTIKNREKQRAALETLLTKGANPNIKNSQGITPLQVAQQMKRAGTEKTVLILEKFGAV